MDGKDESNQRLDKKPQLGGEVDYKDKAGTAWSHSFLNQKPWHPLSYPNQRRKWIAEQTHVQKQRRAEEIAREYAQEQEFLKQTALISKKEKERLEMMKAVSFMYAKPPGYNAESAKAAETADEKNTQGVGENRNDLQGGASSSMNTRAEDKKKPKAKDVFGRAIPTEEQFEVLKNAPRLDTGVAGRAKPFGVEIRNVKCLRCGNHGHQSGDRECPLKDAIMPNEESRLKRDDPLTAILAQADPSEPLKWELKQKPGMSPPRGGFDPDDPNQQIVAEDIFDEYGGFLGEPIIPDLLTNLSSTQTKKKKSKKSTTRKNRSPRASDEREVEQSSSDDNNRKRKSKNRHKKEKAKHYDYSSSSESSDYGVRRHHHHRRKRKDRRKHRDLSSSDASDHDEARRSRYHKHSRSSRHK